MGAVGQGFGTENCREWPVDGNVRSLNRARSPLCIDENLYLTQTLTHSLDL